MSTPATNRHAIRRFTPEQVIDALEAAGYACKREGREVNADITGSGHYHLKINPAKGVWFDASDGDKRGTIARLLRQLGTRAPAASEATGTTSSRHAEGVHEEDNQKKAVELWSTGSWIAATADAMPHAWDNNLNIAQKAYHRIKYEKQCETVRNYIASRLGTDHLDHWMQHVQITTAQGWMITPMSNAGKITGIQRVFFDASGNKTERKMLGKQGVQVLPPPAGVLPRDLGTGSAKNMLIGEGFETVAATVQAAGWQGLACFFDGGIVRYAREQAEIAKTLTPEQIAMAAASIFLVDNDLSGAGQIACAKAVRILRNVGLKAFYAIPPTAEHGGPKGGPKGSDWGDYPKENISSDVLAAHLALAVAHGDRDMPEITADNINPDAGESFEDYAEHDEEYQKHKNWKLWYDSETPEPPVETRPVGEVRLLLQTELQKTVNEYLEWLKDDSEPFLPVLMMPTTGTGKTTAIKALIKDAEIKKSGGRVCVFTADHKQAKHYADAGFFHFYGRNPEPNHCAYCPAHETVKTVQEQNHISQAEVCRRCKHGYRWAIDYYTELDAEKYAERIEDAKQKLHAMDLHYLDVVPCKWQTHLRNALDAKFLVAASGSYSHSLTKGSLVFFDEHFETGKGIRATLQDIDAWAKRNQAIISFLETHVGDPEKLSRHKKAAVFFQKLALAMAAWVGKTGAVIMDAELVAAIREILKIAKETRKMGDDIELADWETLKFNRAGELEDAPLRAAHAIAESLKFGDGYVEDGALVIAASLPVMERMAYGDPTVIMDATPDPVIVDVVNAQGGRIVNAIATQNVMIKRYATRFWGLTALNSKVVGAARMLAEIEKYEKLVQHHYTEFGKTAYLMHARAYKEIGFDEYVYNDDGDPIAYVDFPNIELGMAGYWGRDHRAHDHWSGKELVIVGSFYPPSNAVRAMYQVSRIAALSAGADAENWPAWPDDMAMVSGEYICEGGTDVKCYLPLPSNPHIRKWLLARITAETVQAIGRARGANAHNTITVHIYGGVPLAGLGQHGLEVDSYEFDPECLGPTKADFNESMNEQHKGRVETCDILAARIIAKGGTITRDAMEAEAAEMNAIDEANAALDEATQDAMPDDSYFYDAGEDAETTPKPDESHLFHPRIYIHTRVEQIQMPRDETVREWIQLRMPILAAHMSTKGRNGKVVKEAREIAKAFGEKALMEAMDFAENLVNTGESAENVERKAWNTIENDGGATMVQVAGSRIALTAMDATGDVPPPWKDEDEGEQS